VIHARQGVRCAAKQKWICVPLVFDYKDKLWRVAFGFRALIFLAAPFSVCCGLKLEMTGRGTALNRDEFQSKTSKMAQLQRDDSPRQ